MLIIKHENYFYLFSIALPSALPPEKKVHNANFQSLQFNMLFFLIFYTKHENIYYYLSITVIPSALPPEKKCTNSEYPICINTHFFLNWSWSRMFLEKLGQPQLNSIPKSGKAICLKPIEMLGKGKGGLVGWIKRSTHRFERREDNLEKNDVLPECAIADVSCDWMGVWP